MILNNTDPFDHVINVAVDSMECLSCGETGLLVPEGSEGEDAENGVMGGPTVWAQGRTDHAV